jgi:hypothetical protein
LETERVFGQTVDRADGIVLPIHVLLRCHCMDEAAARQSPYDVLFAGRGFAADLQSYLVLGCLIKQDAEKWMSVFCWAARLARPHASVACAIEQVD